MEHSGLIFTLIMIHAALGGVALTAGLSAAILNKGQTPHRLAGKLFVNSGILCVILSMIITFFPGHWNPFLFSIGLFTLYFLLIGIRSIQYKSVGYRYQMDKLLTWSILLCCVLMIVLPIVILQVVNIVTTIFGALGLFLSITNLRKFTNNDQMRKEALRFHIIHMSGGLISMVSAFFVVNDFFPSLVNWFLPSIVGTSFIMISLKKYVPKGKLASFTAFVAFGSSLLLVPDVNAQKQELVNERVFSKSQMINDYEVLYASLINYHPTPFVYSSETELKQYFDSQIASFPDNMIERQFFVVAKQLIAKIKCGHTTGEISPTWVAAHKNQLTYLPFGISQNDGKVYIRCAIDSTFAFAPGDELLGINGLDIQEILDRVGSTIQRDGNTFSFVQALTSNHFGVLYMRVFGQYGSVAVKYRQTNGDTLTTLVKMENKSWKPVKIDSIPSNLNTLLKNGWSSFAVDSLHGIAYLRISDFMNRKEYKKYYSEVFRLLLDPVYHDLIIDLRQNGGGYFGNGNRLLTYLTPEQFDFNFEREKRPIIKNKYTKMDKWNKLTKLAFSVKPSKHKIKGVRRHTFTFKPNKNRFMGQVHVITDGITFSQSVVVAAQLHQYGAIFYGSETGGTESSTNAMVKHQVTLPHSGIQVGIPYYKVITNSTKGSFGLGIMPDHNLIQRISNQDEVLTAVLQKIILR